MPDREPLPPLDQWPAPRRWRERNASSLTPEQIQEIAAAVYNARHTGMRPGQAYGWYAPGDDLTQPPRVRRTDHDDMVDAIAMDRYAQSLLSTVLNTTASSEPPMPIQLRIGHNDSGFLMTQQEVDLIARFGNYPDASLLDSVINENQRLVGEVASMSRMLVAMEARLTNMERLARTTPSTVTVFPEAVRPNLQEAHPARPAVSSVAGHPVANVRDAPFDVVRSVPPGSGGASPAVGAERHGDDAGTRVGATAAGGGAAPAGATGSPAPGAATPAPVVASGAGVLVTVPSPAGVTVDRLRAEITAYTQRFGIERGRVLMLEHGRAATVSTVPAERRAFVIAAIRQASEMPTAATPAAG